MSHEKVPWIMVGIGWIAGTFVAIIAMTIFQIPAILVLVAMILLPLAIDWLQEMTGIFKNRH